MAFQRILSLSDFSDLAELAVQASFQIASKFNSELFIYHHIQEKEIFELNLSQDRLENWSCIAQEHINKTLTQWKNDADNYKVPLKFGLGGGKFMLNVSELIEKHKIDLIIMGSAGAGGKKEYFWGSNTQAIANSVVSPLLVIKSPLQDYHFDHIVYASSFTKRDLEVFEYFLRFFPIELDSTIHLLCIDTKQYFSQPTILIQQAMKDFEKLAKGFKVKSHFYGSHSVDSGIRDFVKSVNPDLLVMSNKFEKPLKHFFKGNETLRIINHAEFPVLAINY